MKELAYLLIAFAVVLVIAGSILAYPEAGSIGHRCKPDGTCLGDLKCQQSKGFSEMYFCAPGAK